MKTGYMYFFGICLMTGLTLFGCGHKKEHQYHDPQLAYQKQDYQNLTAFPSHPPIRKRKKIKRMRFYQAKSMPMALRKSISISVMEAIPLSELLLTLAQQAEVDLVVDPHIQAGVTMNARNRPLIDIIDELCRLHDLRYQMTNGILRIEKDTPYLRNYNLQFLIMARANRNRLSIATDVFTNVEKGTRVDEDNGSNTFLTAETKSDFWEELQNNLDVILGDFGPGGVPDESSSYNPKKFCIHKQAGIISIKTSQKQHEQIARYLDLLQENVGRQVLIEAKIVEVNLKDQYKTGINWNLLRGSFVMQSSLGDIATQGQLNELMAPAKNVFTLGGNAEKITGLLSVLNQFGTVRALSNPRLTVMNNNPAVLKVAHNKVYFKLNQTRDFLHAGNRERTSLTSEVKTVPIGLMMYVHPTIAKNGQIIMTLRPTISQIVQEVQDPAVGIASNAQQQSLVPEVQVRELDTILSMNSGEIVVVGGLMEERSSNQQNGVPVAEDVPFVGGLFKGKSHDRRVTELVIFMRATVIESDYEADIATDSVEDADKTLYKKHMTDPRPLF